MLGRACKESVFECGDGKLLLYFPLVWKAVTLTNHATDEPSYDCCSLTWLLFRLDLRLNELIASGGAQRTVCVVTHTLHCYDMLYMASWFPCWWKVFFSERMEHGPTTDSKCDYSSPFSSDTLGWEQQKNHSLLFFLPPFSTVEFFVKASTVVCLSSCQVYYVAWILAFQTHYIIWYKTCTDWVHTYTENMAFPVDSLNTMLCKSARKTRRRDGNIGSEFLVWMYLCLPAFILVI